MMRSRKIDFVRLGNISMNVGLEKKSTEPRLSDRESYVKGRVIHREHELYTLSIAMMIGLKTSIGRTNSVLWHDKNRKQKWLESDNFMEVVKYLFPPKGSDITPKHNLGHTFKFKDYSPFAFAYLRRMFGVNEFEFLQSICGNANFIQFMSNAKSGQFMFYSCDGKYMIKTITTTESKFLRRILPHYFRHCFQNPNTLVSRFYGMYRVKMYHLERRVKFIIMNSVFDTDKYLHNFYDLKGSSLGREAAPTDAVKKDNDLRRELPQGAFVMPKTVRSRLRKQLVVDCNFLASMKIMDYSLLVGIHNLPTQWCTTTRVTSDEVSPQGSPRVSVEIDSFPKQSFRKNWNLPPINSPQYPSISIQADGGLSEQLSGDEADNEIDSIPSHHSASRRPPLPPISSRASSATSSSAPPIRLRRARSNSDSRLLTDTRKVRHRSLKQDFVLRPRPGLGSSKSSRHFASEGADEGNHAALPSVTLTPLRPAEPVVTIPKRPKHIRDASVGSLKIPIDSILDSSDAASHNPYFSDDQTLSEQSTADQSVLHNIDVALHSDDDGSYLGDERQIPKDLSLSKEKLNNFIRNKEIMTERFFWPFHQLYTVQGKRRLSPSVPIHSEGVENSTDDASRGARDVTDSVPKFVSPISNRKDSGIEMDMSAFDGLPQDETPNPKIYFVGIIDILQQFNSRKRVEARWRTLQAGREGASCVHPQLYADRFMRFFDEYTQRRDDTAVRNHKVDEDDNDYEGIEEVTFSRGE
uniref:PIPK domain-containing protein n=1 Tax=Leptocylindrus danicus TaxID=163516 RepID=A0A7S2NXK0_9STRA|mmetsp:Transcript_17433/g.25965  ORF Transcript_17433/g.25965 Transcript_17433/m.25965 type:complete len:751 (+) Transcript_17433:297-2549(+)